MIPLKAKAWLDLQARKASGGNIDEDDIHKHRNDIFRLSQVLDPTKVILLPQNIRNLFQEALSQLAEDSSISLTQLGIRGTNKDEILSLLRRIYL